MLSKRENWGFLNFGPVAIKSIYEEVTKYSEEWFLDESRQQEYKTHEKTQMFQILSMDYYVGLEQNKQCIIKNKMNFQKSKAELQDIFDKVESIYGGSVIRAEFINMLPSSRVRMHKDRSDILYVSRRFHIPIKTNKLVYFVSNDEKMNLEQGNIYELNNINYHGVYNNSLENRIHLIVDVLPDEYLKNFEVLDETF
jgi:hypothetical protein